MRIALHFVLLGIVLSVVGSVGCTRQSATDVRLGYLPVAECTPLFVAQSEGFFAKNGLKVKLTEFEDGPTVIAATLGGSLDGGLAGIVPILFAAQKDESIRMVSDGGHVVPAGHPYVGLVVKAGANIDSVAALKGKTVAVNGLKTLEEALLRVALNKAGIAGGVNVVALPHPNMVQALISGTIDGSMAIEPYISMGLTQKEIKILAGSEEIIPSFQLSAIFFSTQFVGKQHDKLKRFTAAYNDAIDFIVSNPTRAKQIVAEWTKTPASTANAMTLPGWSKDLPIAGIEQVSRAMFENKFMERLVDLDAYIYKPGSYAK